MYGAVEAGAMATSVLEAEAMAASAVEAVVMAEYAVMVRKGGCQPF